MRIDNKNIDNLRKIKRLLIVVDMINGFVRKGALAHEEIAEIIPENIKLVKRFLDDSESAVCMVRDSHTKDAAEFKTFPEHCLAGTKQCSFLLLQCRHLGAGCRQTYN